MPRVRRNAKHPIKVHGLFSHMEKWEIDKRTTLARKLDESRVGIASLFPNGPDPASCMLIDRIIYKGLKLHIFEQMDLKSMVGGRTKTDAAKEHEPSPLTPFAEGRYVTLANSLREDIRLLNKLAQAQNPSHEEDNLTEYLRFKKAEKINLESADKPESPKARLF